jgi:hypothetical protein
MNEQEERFVSLSKEMHTLALQAAQARKILIMIYLTEHYPGVPYTITIMEDNILAVDIVFPGLGRNTGKHIVDEVTEYLQGLLQSANTHGSGHQA